ncbi:MAG TPA: hypothetical protein VGI57_06895 [Usitatibacter sp.]|jgi:hypothetical protein
MKRLILLAFVALSLPGLAADSDPRTLSFTLPARDVHEECMHLNLNDWRKYEWKSDVPVDFNIHYHRGSKVYFPVKKSATKAESATFAAKSGEDYCWMWTGGKAPAMIEGRIEAP